VANNSVLDHRGLTPVDYGYAVFGRVLSGMDVVDRIAAVRTGSKGDFESVPVVPVVIKAVTVKPAR
jgi:cyclophilin family peptidyl-prolyl cis-trans isomerase